jgi:hypothetical protein
MLFGGAGGRVMNWLKRLFQSRRRRRRPLDEAAPSRKQVHDFRVGTGPLPIITPSHTFRLHVTAKGDILLDEQPIELADLEKSLKAGCKPETVVLYSRDNPEQDSPVAADVIGCVHRLGLRYAIADAKARSTWLILRCWQGFREVLLRQEEGSLQPYCTEPVYAALKKGKRQATREVCGADSMPGELLSMLDTDRSAVMTRKLQKHPQAGNPEGLIELEVRSRNSEDGWRVAQIAAADLTVP